MTTHKMLRIPLADIEVLRLTCRKCGAAVELRRGDVQRRLRSGDCPFCNALLFRPERGPHPLAELVRAIDEVLLDAEQVDIDLVLPADE